MLGGAHIIIYSKDADADRAFLRDVLELPGVDVGDGWLIFALPPAEVAVHPAEGNSHELYLMCADVEKLVADLGARGVACDPVANRGWGLLTAFTLPGGGRLGVYEPRHARPTWPAGPERGPRAARAATRAARPPRRPAARPRPQAGRRTTRSRPQAGRRATKRR